MTSETNLFSGLTCCVVTFGCQMNKHDAERIQGMTEALGIATVDDTADADVVVYMTCCVREAADVRLLGQVNTLKGEPLREKSPLGRRIVAIGGCIGQRDGQALLQQLSNVDIVFGTHNLAEFPQLLRDAVEGVAPVARILDASSEFSADLPTHREHPWAAWLPITIGCNNFCTYCIVPYVRGREKSRPFQDVVAEAQRYVDEGVREITLLGQNVNSYGRDLYGHPRFAELLEAVAACGIERLRFATSHPKDLNDQVIQQFATLPALMPALHLPVQSGSNRVLQAMNRNYTREHYLGIIDKLRAARPDIALSTDIIVGFPGETEEDFQQTCDLVSQVGYHQVFTFIYSKRDGTPAAAMADDTPRDVIQNRFDRLVDLVQEQAFAANQPDRGCVVDVLFEGVSKRDESLLAGKSAKNQTVHAPVPAGRTADDFVGRIAPVKIDQARTWYLKGTLVERA